MLPSLLLSWIILPLWAVGMGTLMTYWHYRNQQAKTAVPLLIHNQR